MLSATLNVCKCINYIAKRTQWCIYLLALLKSLPCMSDLISTYLYNPHCCQNLLFELQHTPSREFLHYLQYLCSSHIVVNNCILCSSSMGCIVLAFLSLFCRRLIHCMPYYLGKSSEWRKKKYSAENNRKEKAMDRCSLQLTMGTLLIVPVAPVTCTLSEPARSTRLSLLNWILLCASCAEGSETVISPAVDIILKSTLALWKIGIGINNYTVSKFTLDEAKSRK